MNDALFCSIHVDSALEREEMASLVAASSGGVVARGGVDCPWARIAVDDDDGDFEARQRDRDDFLGWKTLLEVMPLDGTERNEVVRGVTLVMHARVVHGLRVLAQAEYADELPGGGEIMSPGRSLA